MATSFAQSDSELLQLLQLINESTHAIAQAYTDAGLPHPSTNNGSTPYPTHAAQQPAVHQAALVLSAACRQLIAATAVPAVYTMDLGGTVRSSFSF